jgi:molecular chaperone DnaK (HSP70)
MTVIGVDFGNENCVVCCVVDEKIKVIENEYNKSKTP